MYIEFCCHLCCNSSVILDTNSFNVRRSLALSLGFRSLFLLLSRLIQYPKEIIGDHQCGFRCNRSTTDHIFCIRQILEKKWEYNEPVHQLSIDFKKAYDSVRREVLYKFLTEFGIPRKLVRLIKTSLTETYSRVRVGENVFDRFPIRNGLKQRDALSPLFFNFALE